MSERVTMREWLRRRDELRDRLRGDAPLKPDRRRRFDVPEKHVDLMLLRLYSRDLSDPATWQVAANEAISKYGLEFVVVGSPEPHLVLRSAATGREPSQLVELRGEERL